MEWVSGETEESVSGWTTDTLHSHIQVQLQDLRTLLDERNTTQQVAMQAALAAAEKAVLKAEVASDKRFESVNEFRAQLADQANTFLPRAEAKAILDAISTKVDDLGTRLDRSEGKSTGLNAGWVILGGAVGLVLAILVIYNMLRGGA